MLVHTWITISQKHKCTFSLRLEIILVCSLLLAEVDSTTEVFETTSGIELPATINVWPFPQKILLSADKVTLSLHSTLVIHTASKSTILNEGVKRYKSILKTISKGHTESNCGNNTVRTIKIDVDGFDETLSLNTSYKYSVAVDATTGIVIHAESPFGAL